MPQIGASISFEHLHGLIQLIVTISAVTNHINNNIRTPFMPPFNRSLQTPRNSHGIIPITMKDWTIECLAKIRSIRRRSTVDGVGSKSNLIVHNNVNGTADFEIVHTHELHSFVDDTLSGEGGISVKKDGHDVAHVFFCVAAVELFCAGFAQHYGVDAFQMSWVL